MTEGTASGPRPRGHVRPEGRGQAGWTRTQQRKGHSSRAQAWFVVWGLAPRCWCVAVVRGIKDGCHTAGVCSSCESRRG
jgi:hypothetical protein